ncbi:hypothetical protein [Tropicimonas sp. IMCC6043]|uniref:hypothetical protein n=1 Tax=Tropicimonas sp. IMCC6043 TaxID=2510645 RepID=UPI00101DCAA6|nr:hypothetical protein [Tropicimonas sp. IMCC6043]RYH08456.1 hypothetical protein EU800_16660 [Tropicimonas sp. IMCC6043]
MPREVPVRLIGPLNAGGKDQLSLEIDGAPIQMRFRISQLSHKLVAVVPEVVHDLLDIAATVYAADCRISRGGLAGSRCGEDWRRKFHLTVPVRCREIWENEEITNLLEEVVGFLSDDFWRFSFADCEDSGPTQGIFDFGTDVGFQPGRILMFSGGLDSFAGAVEELVERRERVVLVSHVSATKMARVQNNLIDAFDEDERKRRLMRVSLTAQLADGKRREGTQRSRSFLFASLGLAVAEMFGLKVVHFFENGVVSLNLPPVPQVIGARATRTTHPKVLAGLGRLFSALLGERREVRNPYLFRTKGDVLETIRRLGFADQIRHTRSCADVHNLSRMHSHCGRCSQCIDRRFAVLSQGLEDQDPGEAYAHDLLKGDLPGVRDREMALSYVRNAQFLALADIPDFQTRFPEVLRAINDIGDPPGEALRRLHDLHWRHGKAVTSVMNRVLGAGKDDTGAYSLPSLYRAAQLEQAISPSMETPEPETSPKRVEIILSPLSEQAKIGGTEVLTGVAYRLLARLAEPFLQAAGQGLVPEDYPCLTAAEIADGENYADEGGVRRAVQTARRKLAASLGKLGLESQEVIETIPPYGYRIAPDRVTLRIDDPASVTKRPNRTKRRR